MNADSHIIAMSCISERQGQRIRQNMSTSSLAVALEVVSSQPDSHLRGTAYC